MGDEIPVPIPTVIVKKKKDEKYRKRDPRSWENITRATANMSLEEKQQYLQNAYNELYNENRTSTINLQAREKQYAQCLREHEKDRGDLTKSILARGQLESLCRELQKQNKLIKEENVARIKEEEDRRREVANTFSERLNALTNLITESKDKSNKVKEENQNMTQKLTELYEQYQQRETRMEALTRQLDLQKKLSETQIKKIEIEHEAAEHTMLAQKKALELHLEQQQKEMDLLQDKNKSLEAQVELYKSQYTDFETTMSKSTKVFDTFKGEMSKMSKQIRTLEAERNDIRKRWQSSVNSLVVLSEQHMTLSNEHTALEKRLHLLQKLCRQLQEERGAFLKQLKENNIEPKVSTKSNDGKENDAVEQEIDKKNETRAVKLKEELDKVKKTIKMSGGTSTGNFDGPCHRHAKRVRRVQFSSETPDINESLGEPPVTASKEISSEEEDIPAIHQDNNEQNLPSSVPIKESIDAINVATSIVEVTTNEESQPSQTLDSLTVVEEILLKDTENSVAAEAPQSTSTETLTIHPIESSSENIGASTSTSTPPSLEQFPL